MHKMSSVSDVAHRLIEQNNHMLLHAANHVNGPMLVLNAQRHVVFANRAVLDLTGYEFGELVVRDPASVLLSPAMSAEERAFVFSQPWGQGQVANINLMIRTKDERDVWVHVSSTPMPDDEEHGIVGYSVDSLTDITEERQIRLLERDVLAALNSSISFQELGNFICNRIERIAPRVLVSICRVADRKLRPWAAPSFHASYGPDWEGVEIGEGVAGCGTAAHRGEPVMVFDIETDPLWAPYKHQMLPYGYKACWTYPVKRRDGSVAATFAFYFKQGGEPNAYLERVADASLHLCALAIERYETQQQLEQISHFDSLTGLLNRAGLHERAGELLTDTGERKMAFFVLDLDRFKDINETLGHLAGDKVLVEVANRLEKIVPLQSLVSRYGEDSFVIVLPDCDVRQASALAQRVLERLKMPLRLSGLTLNISGSIGISLYLENGRDGETLLKSADSALALAKGSGKGEVLFFSPEMNCIAQDRVVLGAALRAAIASNGLRLVYQPQFHPSDRSLYGVEALARWSDPDLGEISPGKFTALAEEIGEIEAIGHWSLREVCRQMADWRRAGIEIPKVSVNLSPIHFRNPDLPRFIAELLREHDLPARCLTVEITENLMIDQKLEARQIIHDIRALGVGLSMDDFGTGFASLSNLAHLPFTELKIDRSFIADFETDSHALALVTAVIRIGQSLGLSVVAEGVETEDQRKRLTALGCDVIQGYVFSRALQPTQIAGLFRPGMASVEGALARA